MLDDFESNIGNGIENSPTPSLHSAGLSLFSHCKSASKHMKHHEQGNQAVSQQLESEGKSSFAPPAFSLTA